MLELDAARRGDASPEQRQASETAARQAFATAVRLDPGFEGAREEFELLSVQPTDLAAYEAQILEQIEHPGELDERLIRSGTLMGIGPGPGRGGSRLGDSGGRPRANTGFAVITIGGTVP